MAVCKVVMIVALQCLMVLIGLSNATLGAKHIVDIWENYLVCENSEIYKLFGFCNGVLYDHLL